MVSRTALETESLCVLKSMKSAQESQLYFNWTMLGGKSFNLIPKVIIHYISTLDFFLKGMYKIND